MIEKRARLAAVAVWLSGAFVGAAAEEPVAVPNGEPPDPPVPLIEAYDSWKLAQAGEPATNAATISAPPGFSVELLRSAREGEDSWVGMSFDGAGDLIVAMEKTPGLLRMKLGPDQVNSVTVVEDTLEECRGLLWAHEALYANANNSKGFYRLRDTTGDGVFDEKKLLLETTGGVGHGRNHLRLGPDGFIYLIHGNNVEVPAEKIAPASPYRNFGEDQLILSPWDDSWNRLMAPAGQVLRTDKDGTSFEMIAGGLRNALDGDFNRDGEFFVYDADSEWDSGLPWYKPTRVLHLVSGGEYGWRRGTGKWPAYYADSLPSVVDIGLGSPTGVGFGYKSAFPAKYREAFYIADWWYGRLLAVHLEEKGASYAGTTETFLSGRPLNITDFVFHDDGALYFITGGRRTQSGLYRVRWTGTGEVIAPEPEPEPAGTEEGAKARARRTALEAFHGAPDAGAGHLDEILRGLESDDRSLRFAARVALERQPVDSWRKEALASNASAAWLALARCGSADDRAALLERLNALALAPMDEEEQLRVLRVYQVAFTRLGAPSEAERKACLNKLSAIYPSPHRSSNHELCELLVYLEAPDVLEKTLRLAEDTTEVEDRVQFLFYARYLKDGWTRDRRKRYLETLRRAEEFAGGRWYLRTTTALREEALAAMSVADRAALADLLEAAVPRAEALVAALSLADPVHDWSMNDFEPSLARPLRNRSFESGRDAYTAAACVACHRMAGNEASARSVLGPDLSGLGGRFGAGDVLESVLHPSRVIADLYRNPAGPNVSSMPVGLINVLERGEVLDLLAYVLSGGDAGSSLFR